MRSIALTSSILVLALASAASGQQELYHFDGTAEFASRGVGAATENVLCMQRIPAEQLMTATTVDSWVAVLQDQNYTTPETVTLQYRRNNPANNGFFDHNPAGLIATVAVGSLAFPMPPAGVISAAQLTVTITGGLAIPAGVGDQATPAGDLYVGMEMPGKPSTADILLGQASGALALCSGGVSTAGEQYDLTQAGYNGVVNQPAMGQSCNLTTGTAPVLNSGNRSWRWSTRFLDDVMQPFAANAGVFTGAIPCPAPGVGGGTGLNPNFGYAGIFTDLARGDGIGVRHRVAAPVGTASLLFASFGTVTPYSVFGLGGKLALDPATLVYTGALLTAAAAGQPATVSDATYGPAVLPPTLTGTTVNFQGIKNVGGVYTASAMGTIRF